MAVQDEVYRQAMRWLSGGVTIIATKLADECGGLTATAVCSLALDPARILVCTNLQGRTYRMIAESRRMSVNVLGQGQEELAKAFAGMTGEHGNGRFKAGAWVERVTGAPVLADAVMALDCVVMQSIVFETHAVLIGRVEDVLIGAHRAPLIYLNGRFSSVMAELSSVKRAQ